jgi:TRAP-type uncharacterized transport system substrate-binding protein
MDTSLERVASITIPHLRGNRPLAFLALSALAASAGFWYWNTVSKDIPLAINSGVELKYREGMVKVLCDEAAGNGLKLDVQSGGGSKEAIIARVNRGELDAAVIPAGLAIVGENIRQVAILECETLHLFVKPECLADGVVGLKGRRINLGPAGSGGRIIAGDLLKFVGMKAGEDFTDEAHSYAELPKLPPEMLPDAVFSLSPLPSPLGKNLMKCGYQLMELPFADALALREPYLEDAVVPANTYAVSPAVPAKPLHTVGTRSVLIAHRDVSKIAVRRLIEVLYESDFARRVGMQPLDANLLRRSGEYPSHAGTIAYLHRHDPWVNKDFIDNFKSLFGTVVSAISAILLAWGWYRRQGVEGVDDYLRACNKLELDALRTSASGEFGEAELHGTLSQLVALKILVLEKHQEGVFAGDQRFAQLVDRIERLQQTLPSLVDVVTDRVAVALPHAERKAG